MNKEKEIERMAIEQIIRDEFIEWLNVAGCIPQGTTYWCECMGCIEDSAAKLVSAGIGDKKQAVKEFWEKAQHYVKALNNLLDEDGHYILEDTLEHIDNLITELYGADEK